MVTLSRFDRPEPQSGMFSTLDQLTADARSPFDLVILGAGPAGITLALEVARRQPGWRILLAEAGGFEPPTPAERDAYEGESTGAPYSLLATRLRYFGGTSGHWGGWCRPLDRIDFEARPNARTVGWPISHDSLAAHYEAAARQVELSSNDFGTEVIREQHPGRLIEWGDAGLFRNQLFRFSPPTRFGKRYRDAVSESAVTAVLGATATDYLWNGNRVTGVMLKSADGGGRQIAAKRVVLAMGGIESSRHLLLMQRQQASVAGLSSHWNGVGFADHFGVRPGALWLTAGLGYHRHENDSGPHMAVISPAEAALRERDWNNSCMLLEATGRSEAPVPQNYVMNRGLGFSGRDMWLYDVQMIAEPRPGPDSRISLAESVDSFGLPRTHINWQVDTRDVDSAKAQFAELCLEVGRLGIGRGRMDPVDAGAVVASPTPACHHMGTARMSVSAADGVVDEQLRVHGSDNLYVLSSAVFPCFGFSNPTLTICALAFRLAEHLEAA